MGGMAPQSPKPARESSNPPVGAADTMQILEPYMSFVARAVSRVKLMYSESHRCQSEEFASSVSSSLEVHGFTLEPQLLAKGDSSVDMPAVDVCNARRDFGLIQEKIQPGRIAWCSDHVDGNPSTVTETVTSEKVCPDGACSG